jgi:multiple sugar transport system ATP-binding protein
VQARAEISKLHHRLGTTFIYVTHDQTEAMTMGTRIAVMKDGLLHQIDSPQVLYDTPNNVFVAGFIGSPSMNFFDVTLTGGKDEMYVDGGTFRMRVPPDKAQVYAGRGYQGKQVIFGIRPEDIYDPDYIVSNIYGQQMQTQVDVTELMGNEVFVYLLSGEKQFIARVDPRTQAHVGGSFDAVVNMDRMHIFDRDTELAIRSVAWPLVGGP